MIYICHTTYHLLISLVTAYSCHEKINLLLGVGFPKNEFYYSRLENCDIVEKCFNINDAIVNDRFILSDMKAKKFFNETLKTENDIFIFNDSKLEGRYLRTNKIRYVLIEDGLNSFKMDYFSRVCERSKKRIMIGRLLGLNVGKDERNPYIKYLIVNDKKIINKYNYEVVEMKRSELFSGLSFEEKEKIWEIFSDNEIEKSLNEIKNSTSSIALLLTQPLFKDRFVETEEDQKIIYEHILAEYNCDGVIIKPHPRDELKYTEYFKNSIVINRRDFPVELFNFINGIKFELAITISSTSIDGLTNIKKRVKIGEDSIGGYLDCLKMD